MLGKLRRLLSRSRVAEPLSPPPRPGCTSVVFDTGKILLYQCDGRCGSIGWNDLGSVTLATTADGHAGADAF